MNGFDMQSMFPSFPDQRISHKLTERLVRLLGQLDGQMSHAQEVRDEEGGVDMELNVLRAGMSDIAALIARTRTEVAGLNPQRNSDTSRIAAASDELNLVVDTTEQAAGEIMTGAETIQAAAARLRALALPPEAAAELARIDDAANTVFTACSFQDLTGQRIRKVVAALSYVEARVASLRALWSDPEAVAPEEPQDHRPDAHLLNGPSLDGLAQDDVDKLFN